MRRTAHQHCKVFHKPPPPKSSRPAVCPAPKQIPKPSTPQAEINEGYTLNLSSRPERSEAEGSAVRPHPKQISKKLPTPQANTKESHPTPFVIPTEAKRSGGICSAPPPQTNLHRSTGIINKWEATLDQQLPPLKTQRRAATTCISKIVGHCFPVTNIRPRLASYAIPFSTASAFTCCPAGSNPLKLIQAIT
jgi:hypothetical protein